MELTCITDLKRPLDCNIDLRWVADHVNTELDERYACTIIDLEEILLAYSAFGCKSRTLTLELRE